MKQIRIFSSGFWKFTVPVTLRAWRGVVLSMPAALAKCLRATIDRCRRDALPFARQIRLASALAARELIKSTARRFARLTPPERWNFTLALFSYLFVVFALEVVFLRTFLPEDHVVPGENASVSAPLPDVAHIEDPDLLAEVRLLADQYLPTAHAQTLRPGDLLSGLPLPENSETLFDDELVAEALAGGARHVLLTLPAAPEPPLGPDSFDSVRVAVARYSVTMPVDKNAFHPLDKEAFLAAASNPERLKTLFARVSAQQPSGAKALAVLPGTAIAPPLTRMDKIRMADARRRSLGNLSALFESGVRGVFAIGYDPKGGTSYGKYQLSSSKGAIRNFIKYLDKRAPSWAQRLRLAGAANTGGTHGSMPREWKRIASAHTKLFEKLQDDFIHSHYYSPTLAAVREQTGIDVDAQHTVLREVLWSTAVHHGPSGGARIFIQASKRAKRKGGDFAHKLVEEVYRERERRLSRIPLSQRTAIKARLKQEMSMALARLGKNTVGDQASAMAKPGGLM